MMPLREALQRAKEEKAQRKQEAERRRQAEAANAEMQRHAEENRIRADERSREAAKQRAQAESQSRQYILIAAGFRMVGQYDSAIMQYYAALRILHDYQKPNAAEGIIRALFNIPYNFSNPKIAEIYMSIAECYAAKGDYFTAMDCYKKLGLTIGASTGLELCMIKVSEKINSLIDAARTSHRKGDFSTAIATLAEAGKLAAKAKLIKDVHAIEKLEQRFRWEAIKPQFTAEYERLIKIDLHADDLDYNALGHQFRACIQQYENNIGDATLAEVNMHKELKLAAATIQTALQEQELLRAWHAVRPNLTATATRIEAMQKKYDPAALEQIVRDLHNCAEQYTTYSKFLSAEDRVLQNTAQSLAADAKEQLRIKREQEQRELDRQLNQGKERSINQCLQSVHDNLVLGNFAQALLQLTAAHNTARSISHAEDLEQRAFANPAYFSASIAILITELARYTENAQSESLRLAQSIVGSALAMSQHACDQTLLPRHYDRLITNLSAEFKEQWHNFYVRSSIESALLYNAIADKIAKGLTTTAWWQRWAPNNWTKAALCLHANAKSVVALEIREMIRAYVPQTPPVYIQLPILPYHQQATIPVALVAAVSATVVPPPAGDKLALS